MLRMIIIILCIVISVGGCYDKTPISYNAAILTQPRTHLTFEQLQEPGAALLFHMSNFAKPDWAQKASIGFSGSLTFYETQMTTRIKDSTWAGSGQSQFPSFSVDFISDGDVLIPRQKGIISAWQKGVSFWDVIVGVGKIWKEPGDKEWNRASFPLTLVSRKIGQARNCVCTFVYSHKGISHTYMQSSQEISPIDSYQPQDMLVTLPTKYQPKTFEDSVEIIQQYYKTIAERLPIYPLDQVDLEGKLALLFDDDNAWISLGAVIMDGRIYLHPPKTRHGIYPYPNEMRHGVFSVTKTMAGALSMFYLAQRYGEEIFDERITDYIPLLANHPGWKDVTFSHVLNMVTGTKCGDFIVGGLFFQFVRTENAEEGLKLISKLEDLIELPGEKYKYASTNTFVLSYAMQKYVEKKEGKGIYYWDLVRENVLKPIKADYLALQHTEESDGSKGIPTLGWGAYPTIDETAKIALLLINEGKYEDRQLLHKGKIREALNRTEWTGYEASDSINYSHSILSRDVSITKSTVKISYMLGLGGNYVIILPSGVILIRFWDKMEYDINPLVKAVEEIRASHK